MRSDLKRISHQMFDEAMKELMGSDTYRPLGPLAFSVEDLERLFSLGVKAGYSRGQADATRKETKNEQA